MNTYCCACRTKLKSLPLLYSEQSGIAESSGWVSGLGTDSIGVYRGKSFYTTNLGKRVRPPTPPSFWTFPPAEKIIWEIIALAIAGYIIGLQNDLIPKWLEMTAFGLGALSLWRLSKKRKKAYRKSYNERYLTSYNCWKHSMICMSCGRIYIAREDFRPPLKIN